MTRITAETHNSLNAKFQELKAANPHIAMRPTQEQAIARTAAETETWRDMMALSDLASTFATGASVSAATRKRALRLISA